MNKSSEDNIAVPKKYKAKLYGFPYQSMGTLFKGRTLLINRLTQRFSQTKVKPQVLIGMAGIGKTRLAIEYAMNSLDKYQAIFFIRGDSDLALIRSIADLLQADILNLKNIYQDNDKEISNIVLRRVNELDDILLIIDGINDEKSLQFIAYSVLPHLINVHIIVTAQYSKWPDDFKPTNIYELSVEDSKLYLLERTAANRTVSSEKDLELAEELSIKLGGLAIALEQAAAYIMDSRCGFQKYIDDFNISKEQILLWQDDILVKYPKPVLTAWDITISRLNPIDLAILNLSACLGNAPFPIGLFLSSLETLSVAERHILQNTNAQNVPEMTTSRVNKAFTRLADHSIIYLKEDFFVIHQILRDVLWLRLADRDKQTWVRGAFSLMLFYFAVEKDMQIDQFLFGFNPKLPKVAIHLEALIWNGINFDIHFPTVLLSHFIYRYYIFNSMLNNLELIMVEVLNLDMQHIGNTSIEVAKDLLQLSHIYYCLSSYDKAKRSCNIALKILKPGLANLKEVLKLRSSAIRSWSDIMFSENNIYDAKDLLERSMAYKLYIANLKSANSSSNDVVLPPWTTESLVDDIISVALSTSDNSECKELIADLISLSNILVEFNLLRDAEDILFSASELINAKLGKTHPLASNLLMVLARIYEKTNRSSGIISLLEESIKIKTMAFGSHSWLLTDDITYLIQYYIKNNKADNATKLCYYLGEIAKKANDIKIQLEIQLELGKIFKTKHKWDNALKTYNESIGTAIRAEVPYSELLFEVAKCHLKLKSIEMAEKKALELLYRYSDEFGENHIKYADVQILLAQIYLEKKQLTKAERNVLDSMEIYNKNNMIGDLNYALILNVMAEIKYRRAEFKEAYESIDKAITVLNNSFCSDIELSISIMIRQTDILWAIGKRELSELMIKEYIKKCEGLKGEHYISIEEMKMHLAIMLHDTNRYEEANKLIQNVMKTYCEELGQENPETIEAQKMCDKWKRLKISHRARVREALSNLPFIQICDNVYRINIKKNNEIKSLEFPTPKGFNDSNRGISYLYNLINHKDSKIGVPAEELDDELNKKIIYPFSIKADGKNGQCPVFS